MTTRAKRLVPFLLLLQCSILFSVLVWTMTYQLVPTMMTFWSCMVWAVLLLRYAPDRLPSLVGILWRCAGTAVIMVGVWWLYNHLPIIR